MDRTLKLCNVVVNKYYGSPEELDTVFKTMLVLIGMLSFTAILGNLSIIFALKKTSSISPPTRILLKCLAVTDLGNGVLGHPLYIAAISRIRETYSPCENIHEILSALFVIGNFILAASFMTVFLIGVDRFLAIYLHLRYNELVTPKRVVTAVIASWIFCLVSTLTSGFWYLKAGEIIALICGYSCMLLLSIVYVKLFFVARQHAASINNQAQVAMHSTSSFRSLARNKKLAINTFYVYVVFVLCRCPYFITLTVLLLKSQPSTSLKGAVQLTTVLVMVNSSLNPVVFGWNIKEVRQIVKNNFRKLLLYK